jgi:FkbM family methyltransferase
MSLRKAVISIQDRIVGLLRNRLRHSVRLKSAMYRALWLLPESCRRSDFVRDELMALARGRKQVRFVNIGANDGLAGDSLREFIVTRHWSGILVEPVPFVFERLVRAYRGVPGTICENAAIAEVSGTKTFWFVRKNTTLPPGYDQVGSFDREQVLKHEHGLFPGVSAFLESCEVPCLALPDLLAKHQVQAVDVYVIDTEGYDAEIVKQIDLDRKPPALIVYEHDHVPEADRIACESRLRQAGYELRVEGGNTCAVRTPQA